MTGPDDTAPPAAADLAAALRARPPAEPELDKNVIEAMNGGQLADLLALLPARGHA